MIQTRDSPGLRSVPAGLSATRCAVLSRKGGLCADSVVAVVVNVMFFPTTPVEILVTNPAFCLCCLTGNFDGLQDSVDHFANLDAFHLKIRAQQHAVLKDRGGEGFYVLGQDEISFFERRQRA